MLFFPQVPFANLGIWKHSFAKAAKLWVKLHESLEKKQADRVEGGNPVGLSSQFTGCCRESQVDFDFLFEHSLASLFGKQFGKPIY
jgi:hypothetical protein